MMRTFLLLALAAVTANAAAEVGPIRMDQQVQAYHDQQRFNGSVLVVHKGIPILNKGYGMANYEWMAPTGGTTKFRLGSITKQFTAMCVLMLEQQGKLKVDDLASKYVPEVPEVWKDITVYQLITHTSGIYNFTALPGYDKTMIQNLAPLESLKKVMDRPLEFPPGSKFKYSNSGYVLLGVVIERASGGTYEVYLRKHILDPLGMGNTGYDHGETVLPERAAGYTRAGNTLSNAAFIDMVIPHAAGAMYSTTEDLWKWDKALMTEKLLPKEVMERYFTAFKDKYAYGWIVDTVNGKTKMSHGGGINGFSTAIVRIPDEKLLVVTLSNVVPSQTGKIADDLVKLALGQEVDVPKARTEITLDRKIKEQYVGEYPLTPTFILTVSLEGDQLVTQATGQPKIPIFAESETRFFPKVMEATITFQKDSDGKVTGLVLSQGGRETPAKKTK